MGKRDFSSSKLLEVQNTGTRGPAEHEVKNLWLLIIYLYEG